MEEAGFLTGQMLIAMPGIGDPRFERAQTSSTPWAWR
jgi:putative AlgH/UPF0301 family transcriptional regulator